MSSQDVMRAAEGLYLSGAISYPRYGHLSLFLHDI
jgi:DNA topoisomerase IA